MFNPEEEKYLLSCSGNNQDCKKRWYCKDGRELFIEQMDDQHLVNSLLYVARNWPWRSEYYHCLVREARLRNLI